MSSSVFFYEPFYDVERVMDELVGNRSAAPGTQVSRRSDNNDGAVRATKPRMDLHENPEKNIVTATFELPGVKKDDVHIDLQDGRMTVAAETHAENEREEKGYAVRERRYGSFSRTLQLPQGIKEDQVDAKLADGLLTVTFPKASEAATPKKITIK